LPIKRPAFFILLTAIVGILCTSRAQTPPADSLRQARDSSAIPPSEIDSNGTFRLNPDSSYATAVPSEQGLLDAELLYDAKDSIIGNIQQGIIELYNEAVVEYEDIKLRAGYIRINFETSELYAIGLADTAGIVRQKPIFTENGKDYRANEMRYNFDTQKAKLRKIITAEGEGFLHGENVKKTSDEVFYIKNASFTTCSHETPHFRIITPQAKVISNKKIVTRFAYLELLEVPTPLMLPFGFFPTTSERQSGILIPSYGSSQFRGFFLRDGGYYWAINDYLDLTMRGDIYTQGGFAMSANTNYTKRYRYRGSLSLDYDRLKFGREEFSQFERAAFQDQTNFAIRWSHNQDAKAHPTRRFSANVNIASTNYNQVTQTQPENILQNRLNSSISYSKSWQGKPYNLTVNLNHSQNNQTESLNLTLPQINFAVNRFNPFQRKTQVGQKKWYENINVNYTLDARNQISTTMDSPNLLEDIFTKGRAGIQHNLPISANYKLLNHIVFTPSVRYVERWYPNKLNFSYNADSNRVETDTVQGFFANREFSVNSNFTTNLYGTWRYQKGFLKALRHKMTPSVGFSYTPDFSRDFWGYYQAVQVDSLGTIERRNQFQNGTYGSAGNRLQGNANFGVQNTLEAKVKSKKDSTGVRKISLLERFSANTAYNMAAEEFNWSDLRVNASSSILNGLIRMNYNASFDLYGTATDTSGRTVRINEFAFKANNQLARLKNQSFTIGLNINAQNVQFNNSSGGNNTNAGNNQTQDKAPPADDDRAYESGLGITGGDLNYYGLTDYQDFNLPWSLRVDYNLNDNRNLDGEKTVSQALRFSGNVELTPNWKVGFNSGYDFRAKQFTVSNFNFTRELHCWVMTFSWVPFGFQQSYVLTIRVRSNILSDLKIDRRRGIGDFERGGF